MATPAPILDSDLVLRVFDHLENALPPEIQNTQDIVTVFKSIRVREKRCKLLETLVGDTPVRLLALALACTS